MQNKILKTKVRNETYKERLEMKSIDTKIETNQLEYLKYLNGMLEE